MAYNDGEFPAFFLSYNKKRPSEKRTTFIVVGCLIKVCFYSLLHVVIYQTTFSLLQ